MILMLEMVVHSDVKGGGDAGGGCYSGCQMHCSSSVQSSLGMLWLKSSLTLKFLKHAVPHRSMGRHGVIIRGK